MTRNGRIVLTSLTLLCSAGCGAPGGVQPLTPASETAPSTAPEAGRGPLTRDQMEADLRQLASSVKSSWAYHEDKRAHFGVDVDRLLERSLAGLPNEGVGPARFGLLVRAFMAGLKEGHAEAAVGDLTPPLPRRWPLELRPVKEGVAISAAALPEKFGIKPGDLIRSVDGRSVEALVRDAERYVSASTPGARYRLAVSRVTETAAETLKFDLEGVNGERYSRQIATVAGANPAPEGARFAEWQRLSRETGYLRIPTFSWRPPSPPKSQNVEDLDAAMAPAKELLDDAFAALRDTETLILDLRGNPGGSVFLASYVAEHLLPPGFIYHSGKRRRSEETLRMPDLAALPDHHWEQPQVWKPSEMHGVRHHQGPSHRGKLIVLIDELCFSATDDLLACLQDLHPDVRFVGRPTHGGTGEPRKIGELTYSRVPFFFCIQEMRSPKGRLIESRGTVPDIAVHWSRQDIAHGCDPDLAAALRISRSGTD